MTGTILPFLITTCIIIITVSSSSEIIILEVNMASGDNNNNTYYTDYYHLNSRGYSLYVRRTSRSVALSILGVHLNKDISPNYPVSTIRKYLGSYRVIDPPAMRNFDGKLLIPLTFTHLVIS